MKSKSNHTGAARSWQEGAPSWGLLHAVNLRVLPRPGPAVRPGRETDLALLFQTHETVCQHPHQGAQPPAGRKAQRPPPHPQFW